MTLCTDYTVVNENRGLAVAVSLPCKRWGCEHCLKLLRRKVVAQALSGNPNTFVTLTSNPAYLDTPEARAQALVAAWRTIVRRAKKKYGYDSIPFFAVFESTKRGQPHLHILCRVRWLDQKWLSAQMKELARAPIVDVRRVRGRKAAALYVAKYVGKGPERFDGCKRYWQSQDYDERAEKYQPEADAQAGEWRFLPVNLYDWMAHVLSQGAWVELHGRQMRYSYRGPP